MDKYPRTINLTRIKEGNYYENILQKKFTYDEEIRKKVDIKQEFLRQRSIAEKLHQQRFNKLISETIENVQKFVVKSLDLDGTRLFPRQSGQIYGEKLLLDMHISDHEMTFNMIEKSLKKLVNNLHVVRLKSELAKKRSISELLEPCKNSKRIFIIVEQAECLSRVLTETLVGYLRHRLSDETSPTDAVMILFCLSIEIQKLPFDNMHCFGRMEGIVKQDKDTCKSSLSMLLRSNNLKVKLGPDTLNYIYLYSVNADSSITNLKYMHCYSIFEHYNRLEELPSLTEKDYERLEMKHQSLCDDLLYFSILLHEKDVWPEDAMEIYDELETCVDLAASEAFYNAIKGLKKIPHDRLVTRLDNIENEFASLNHKRLAKKNAASIVLSYKDKIVNNKDCQDVVSQLIDDILKYAQNISCASSEDENFYISNRKAIMTECCTSSRGCKKTLDAYSDESSYFGILFKRLLYSSCQVGAGELCDELLNDFVELMSTQKPDDKSRQSSVPPTKRSRRQTTIRATRICDERENSGQEERNGLAKAIFVDMIDSMEHQGIVKLDPRAKGKVIKRLAWPITTNCT